MGRMDIPKWEPLSIDAEQALLGAIFVNNDAYSFVSDFLKPEHFSEPVHQQMFEIMEKLLAMGKPVTPAVMLTFLPDGLIAEGMSVRQYVARVAAEATTIINARDYGLIIRDLALHRRMIDIGAEMQRHTPREVGAFASEAIDAIDLVVSESSHEFERPMDMKATMAASVDASAKAYQKGAEVLGLSWGLRGLDGKTLGLHAGDLIILAARPGMGKTALALSVARNLSKAGHKGLMFSLEMGGVSLGHRLLSDELFDNGPIPYQTLRSGKFTEDQFTKRVIEASKAVADLPLIIEPAGDVSVSQIAAKARRRKRREGLDYIIVDYLQLVKVSDRYNGNRVLEIGEITASLKRLAKELEIPIMLLSQLNRMVEAREDKRPTMADLRESGNIEQDADLIIMLYREAYYLERQQPKNARMDSEEFASWQIRMNQHQNLLDAIVEKQRQGPIGTVKLFCNIASNAVRDLQEDSHP